MPSNRGRQPPPWRLPGTPAVSKSAIIHDHKFYPVITNGYPHPERCFSCSGGIEQHSQFGWTIDHPYAWESGCRCLRCIQERKLCTRKRHETHICMFKRA